MNLLFVNYGDFTSNSLNHIGAFANQLTLLGHACVVAVPDNPDSISVIKSPLFTPVTFARVAEPRSLFPDGRGADIVHAWTPRENVRECVLDYLRRHPLAALLIHLEDNEVFLIESFAQKPLRELRKLSDEALAALLSPRLSHPVRHANFLRVAHGVTCITDRLRDLVPAGKPTHRLLPGIDASVFPQPVRDEALRAEIGVQPHERLLFFPGSTTFANLADIRTLLLAVRLINQRGVPCKLVRAGINPPQFAPQLAAIGGEHVIDLGFIAKSSGRLEPLITLSDVLVQPGAIDDFNDYRLPSKIPEYLWAGRPVVIPRANIGRDMKDGHHALLLDTGSPDEIAEKCLRIFADDALSRRLADGALEFARAHFDLKANTAALASFYDQVKSQAAPIFSDPTLPPSEDVLLAEGDLRDRMRAKEQSLELARGTAAENKRLHAADAFNRAKLQEERHAAEVLRRQLADATESITRLTRQLDESRAELAARTEKVQRMTASFSWQVTAPLRLLRRTFIDARQKKTSAPVATPPPPIAPGFAYVVDEPNDWREVGSTGELRGWVLGPGDRAIAGVRLRAAGKIFDAIHGLPRADLAASQPSTESAPHAGFAVNYELPADTTQLLVLEALTDDGRWHVFATPTAHVAPDLPEHLRRDYSTWVRRYDTLTLDRAVSIRARIEGLTDGQRPLISVLMPVYNTPEPWLVKAVESVRAQLYPNWELCIADDASTAPHVRRILDDYARRDPRIKVTYRGQNGHISAASNSALALATGELVALLDHDDELSPAALAENVFALLEKPALEFIYSDEDKIDEQGRRYDPYFKPDWNPDLFLGQNFTCHLSVLRTSRVRAIGGFREGFEGSQDWDLVLRAVEGLDAARIHHIPRILYHWRAIPGSTALAIDEKSSYPFVAARKALADHLARTGIDAELVPVAGSHWRVKRKVPHIAPRVSIIIPTKNAEPLLRRCVTSLVAKTTYPNFEIVVVNNRSDEPAALAYLDQLRAGANSTATPAIRVLDYDAPFNFSAINNHAVRHAHGRILAFLNNDLEALHPDWLDEMISHAVRPEIGCVGAMLYYPDDTVQHAGIVLGLTGPAGKDGVAGHAFKGLKRGAEGQRNRLRLIQNYSAVTAACLVIRREIFEQVNGFNGRDLPVAFNDVDFCLRVLKSGYRNLWTPFAEFYHHESATRGLEDTPEKLQRFHREAAYMRRTWGRLLDRDPAYNPNLTLQHEDFSLAFPPR